MLKAMVAGLLSVTALVPPAMAQQGERSMDRGQWRRERAERPMPAAEGAQPRPAEPRAWDRGGAPGRPDIGRGGPDRPAPEGRDWRNRPDNMPRPPMARPGPDRDWRGGGDPRGQRDWQDHRDWQDRRDGAPGIARPAPRPDGAWRSERANPQLRFDGRARPAPPAAVWRTGRDDRWDRDWRREPRYDWNRYRAERRSAFRLPRYYAPYGWNGGYRRFGIGVGLAPILYQPRYWIYDPYAYRLPEAEEPYRWVRYYGDALLVDIEDGTVVDVIHGIFE